MSRRRSKNPTTAISITLPQWQLLAVDDQLEYTQSRSKWIATAIEGKLSGERYIQDASNVELLVLLVNRGAITEETFKVLRAELTSS